MSEQIYPSYNIMGFDFTENNTSKNSPEIGQLPDVCFIEIIKHKSNSYFNSKFIIPVDYLISLIEKDVKENKESKVIENPKYSLLNLTSSHFKPNQGKQEDKYNLQKLISP